MRIRIIFIFFIVFGGVTQLMAQQALLKLKNANDLQVYITEIDSVYLTTSKGIYPLEDIEQVSFNRKSWKDQHLYFELSNAGIGVNFDKDLDLQEMAPPPGTSPEDQLEQFKESFAQYKRSNQLGSGLQFTGVMLTVIGLIIEEDALIYTGAAASGAGLAIKIKANNTKQPEN